MIGTELCPSQALTSQQWPGQRWVKISAVWGITYVSTFNTIYYSITTICFFLILSFVCKKTISRWHWQSQAERYTEQTSDKLIAVRYNLGTSWALSETTLGPSWDLSETTLGLSWALSETTLEQAELCPRQPWDQVELCPVQPWNKLSSVRDNLGTSWALSRPFWDKLSAVRDSPEKAKRCPGYSWES